VTQAEQSFCYRVENGKAVRTPIQIGFRDSQYVEVVKKTGKDGGWQDFTGMEEIAANATGLADGQAVTVSTKP
jgi:hypothetical protein